MNIEQKRRELFEAWVAKHNESINEDDIDGPEDIRIDRQGGVYIWANAESAWFAFNAALDAVVIELPHDVSHVTCPPFEEGRDAVLAAIESTGLGLKVKP